VGQVRNRWVQLHGPVPEVEKEVGKESIHATEVSFAATLIMDALAQAGLTGLREVVDTVSDAACIVGAPPLRDLSWERLSTSGIVFRHGEDFRNAHGIDDVARNIANGRVARSDTHDPVAPPCGAANGRFADHEGAVTEVRIRCRTVIVSKAV
jgi:hypothetical protein